MTFITINYAPQGESIKVVTIQSGTTLEEFKVINNIPSNMEFRLKGTILCDNFVFTEDVNGAYLIAAANAKGGK